MEFGEALLGFYIQGVALMDSFAILVAYVHILGVMALGHLLEVSDAHFGLSVLVVRVDAREGEALPFCVAVADPVVRGKGAIVGMIISYPRPSLP